MKRARLLFWLKVSDVLACVGLFGSPAYLWVIGRASNNTEWKP